MRHLPRVEADQQARGDGGAEGAGEARGVDAALLGRVQGGGADPVHHLATGDDGPEEIAARAAAGTGDGERRQGDRGAGMDAGAGFSQAVELEGVRLHAPEQRLGPAGAGPVGGDGQWRGGGEAGLDADRPAPGKAGPEDGASDGVGEDAGGHRLHVRRQVRVAEAEGEGGQTRDGRRVGPGRRRAHGVDPGAGSTGPMNASSTRK